MGHAELTAPGPAPPRSTISLDEYWMPFTPNRDFKADPKMVVRAEGMYLWNDRGDKLIDASSGPVLRRRRPLPQGDRRGGRRASLPSSTSSRRSCAAIRSSSSSRARVAELTPGDLNRIFFVNSGSEAVDTAMKVALAYHQARGQGGRTMFVSRERAYHGVNFGGVALSGMVNNRRKFGPALPGVAHMRHTHLKENYFTQGEGAHGAELAEDLLRFVNLYGAENIAACFVEPIAGSTGCLVPPKGYLKRLREICDAHGILLVFDEVITRLRPHRPDVRRAELRRHARPDDDGQGLTNGAQPMGAVAISERIHDTIMGAAPEGAIEFFHGYTYSGHPAACAAGLATLDIYKNEGLFERGRALSPYFLDAMFSLQATCRSSPTSAATA